MEWSGIDWENDKMCGMCCLGGLTDSLAMTWEETSGRTSGRTPEGLLGEGGGFSS